MCDPMRDRSLHSFPAVQGAWDDSAHLNPKPTLSCLTFTLELQGEKDMEHLKGIQKAVMWMCCGAQVLLCYPAVVGFMLSCTILIGFLVDPILCLSKVQRVRVLFTHDLSSLHFAERCTTTSAVYDISLSGAPLPCPLRLLFL